MQLTFISLFAGIGGIDLGLERAGMRCVAQVEIDDYCNRVLTKHWPDVPKFRDVRSVGAHNLPYADVIAGGFPCQDISNAGKRAGIDGERSGLWTEFARIIRELRPRYVFVENVTALLHRGLDRVLGDLAARGYDAEWQCIPAAALGAPHRRDRIFIVAYPNGQQPERGGGFGELAGTTRAREGTQEEWQRLRNASVNSGADVADAKRIGRHKMVESVFGGTEGQRPADTLEYCRHTRGWGWWKVEPAVGRVVNGVPHRMDRLRGLGNAVVPQCAELVGAAIVEHAAQFLEAA